MSRNRKKKDKGDPKGDTRPSASPAGAVNAKDHESHSRTLRSAHSSSKDNRTATMTDDVTLSNPFTLRQSARALKSVRPASGLNDSESTGHLPLINNARSVLDKPEIHEPVSSDEDTISAYLLGPEADCSSDENSDVSSSIVALHKGYNTVVEPVSARPVYIPNLAASILKAVGRPLNPTGKHLGTSGYVNGDHDTYTSTSNPRNEECTSSLDNLGRNNFQKRQVSGDDEYSNGETGRDLSNDVHRDKRRNFGLGGFH